MGRRARLSSSADRTIGRMEPHLPQPITRALGDRWSREIAFLPLAGMGGAVGLRIWRAAPNQRAGVLGVVIELPKGVSYDDPLAWPP